MKRRSEISTVILVVVDQSVGFLGPGRVMAVPVAVVEAVPVVVAVPVVAVLVAVVESVSVSGPCISPSGYRQTKSP